LTAWRAKRANARAEIEKGKTAAIIEAALKEVRRHEAAGGEIIKTTRPGTGAQPEGADRCEGHYEGASPTDRWFDSSIKTRRARRIPAGGVIKCWTEGVGT